MLRSPLPVGHPSESSGPAHQVALCDELVVCGDDGRPSDLKVRCKSTRGRQRVAGMEPAGSDGLAHRCLEATLLARQVDADE